jgi:hypothetical protein
MGWAEWVLDLNKILGNKWQVDMAQKELLMFVLVQTPPIRKGRAGDVAQWEKVSLLKIWVRSSL